MGPLEALLKESEAYSSFDLIESAIEGGSPLVNYPIQPLYLSIRSLPAERASDILPRLSSEQRQAFMDLDLWKRDDIDVDTFDYWLAAYAGCADDSVRSEFIKSAEFLLYTKNRFNIWTFDVEDPEYPDHDNYFLTDDSLLLFEFHESYPHADEVRSLVRELYGELGVEKAYSFLFKMVSEGALSLAEEEYRFKKERLRDFGFVDYYESLELISPFPKLEVLKGYLKKKTSLTPKLDGNALKQALHHSAVASYKEKIGPLSDEMQKVKNKERLDFLTFSFIRLVNASVEIDGALKEGTVAMGRVGRKTRQRLLLGLDYLRSLANSGELALSGEEGVLERFDFGDLYRIGHTLISTLQRPLKRELAKYGMEESEESFLGATWNDLLDLIFNETLKSRVESGVGGSAKDVESYQDFETISAEAQTLLESLPFVKRFHQEIESLNSAGRLQSSYYINYAIEDIDYEAILISSFANNFLSAFKANVGAGKLGLTMSEFRIFVGKVLNSNQDLLDFEELKEPINSFLKLYGLAGISAKAQYLYTLLKNQLEGYDYQNMGDDEFKHVGGPILLHAKN